VSPNNQPSGVPKPKSYVSRKIAEELSYRQKGDIDPNHGNSDKLQAQLYLQSDFQHNFNPLAVRRGATSVSGTPMVTCLPLISIIYLAGPMFFQLK
jgi:hypothetical protein